MEKRKSFPAGTKQKIRSRQVKPFLARSGGHQNTGFALFCALAEMPYNHSGALAREARQKSSMGTKMK